MPLYEYACLGCGNVLTEKREIAKRMHNARCSLCGADARRTVETATVKVFKPYRHDNLDEHPVEMTGYRQEKREFEKRGLIDAR